MENRHLFRAKTMCIVDIYNSGKKDGEWVSGSLRYDCGKNTIFQFELDIADYTEYEVDPSTICQCTGLKDKNGKLIWENDIVFVTDEDGCTGGYDTGMGQIMFLKGLWYIDGTVQNGLYDTFDEGFNIEVIGNKFDNPELLEVQE